MHKRYYSLSFLLVVAFVTIGIQWGCLRPVQADSPNAVSADDAQVLASGPIHEAFAEAVALDPEPGLIAPKAPPKLIEEIPPDQKPEGDVRWIPGYWAWDDEKDDYIWVSGIWRVPPPDRAWIPGYWHPVRNGYQWISGYWADANAKEAVYLPDPPESVEVGPSSSPPSDNYIWIPGCWLWQHGRYAWRPGYWAAAHQDWMWVPSHYAWTPRGYIFIGGYWDYTVVHRGVLFAPVYFPPRVHLSTTFLFSPAFIINLSIFDDALFLRPRYSHYYFGDFYAPAYYRIGIYPWFSLHARRVAYDPIFYYQRWHHRHDERWERNLETRFQERREHADLRPPKHYTRGSDFGNRSSNPQRQYVMPMDRVGRDQAANYRFRALSEKERQTFMRQESAVRTYRGERRTRELNSGNSPEPSRTRPEPSRESISRSPITDRSTPHSERRYTPPTRQAEPQPNPRVEPLERRYDRSDDQYRSGQGGEREDRTENRGSSARQQDRFQRSDNNQGRPSGRWGQQENRR